MIQFEFLFVFLYMVWNKSWICFFTWVSRFSSTMCLKCLSPLNYFGTLSKMNWAYMYGSFLLLEVSVKVMWASENELRSSHSSSVSWKSLGRIGILSFLMFARIPQQGLWPWSFLRGKVLKCKLNFFRDLELFALSIVCVFVYFDKFSISRNLTN